MGEPEVIPGTRKFGIKFDRFLQGLPGSISIALFIQGQGELETVFGLARRKAAGCLQLADRLLHPSSFAQADGELMMQGRGVRIPTIRALEPNETRADVPAVEKEHSQLQSAGGLIGVVPQ